MVKFSNGSPFFSLIGSERDLNELASIVGNCNQGCDLLWGIMTRPHISNAESLHFLPLFELIRVNFLKDHSVQSDAE